MPVSQGKLCLKADKKVESKRWMNFIRILSAQLTVCLKVSPGLPTYAIREAIENP